MKKSCCTSFPKGTFFCSIFVCQATKSQRVYEHKYSIKGAAGAKLGNLLWNAWHNCVFCFETIVTHTKCLWYTYKNAYIFSFKHCRQIKKNFEFRKFLILYKIYFDMPNMYLFLTLFFPISRVFLIYYFGELKFRVVIVEI